MYVCTYVRVCVCGEIHYVCTFTWLCVCVCVCACVHMCVRVREGGKRHCHHGGPRTKQPGKLLWCKPLKLAGEGDGLHAFHLLDTRVKLLNGPHQEEVKAQVVCNGARFFCTAEQSRWSERRCACWCGSDCLLLHPAPQEQGRRENLKR